MVDESVADLGAELGADLIADLMERARQSSALSRSELARRTGSTRAALLEYEKGVRVPRADTFLRLLDATGATINVQLRDARPEEQSPIASSLARAVGAMAHRDDASNWRLLISDFVANDFVPATRHQRVVQLGAEPTPHLDQRWNCFIAALCEHLAFHAEIALPAWMNGEAWRSTLSPFWWPVHGELASMRAASVAWTPASFRRRGILLDGRELPLVTR